MFIFVYTGDTLISAIRRGIGLNVLMGTTPIAFNKRCACFTSNNLFVVVVVGCLRYPSSRSMHNIVLLTNTNVMYSLSLFLPSDFAYHIIFALLSILITIYQFVWCVSFINFSSLCLITWFCIVIQSTMAIKTYFIRIAVYN